MPRRRACSSSLVAPSCAGARFLAHAPWPGQVQRGGSGSRGAGRGTPPGRYAPALADRPRHPGAPAGLRGMWRVADRCFPKQRELCRNGRPPRPALDGLCGVTTDRALGSPTAALPCDGRQQPLGRLELTGRRLCAPSRRRRCKAPQYLSPPHGFGDAHGRAGGTGLAAQSAKSSLRSAESSTRGSVLLRKYSPLVAHLYSPTRSGWCASNASAPERCAIVVP